MMRKLFNDPLLHFFVAGALIFLVYSFTTDEPSNTEIVITDMQIARMVEGWEKTRMRPPTEAEIRALVDEFVLEEVYYREALALGLDKDNPIVRRVMRQKMEFLADSTAPEDSPSDDDLRAFMQDNSDLFMTDGRTSFRHVFFSSDTRNDARTDAERALARLQISHGIKEPARLGDPFLLGDSFEELSDRELRGTFGSEFAESLASLDTDSWQGPIRSGYGLHLILISERAEPGLPELENIRDNVEFEWRQEQQRRARSKFYDSLRDKYTVVIEGDTSS